jgi:metallophosphoesterase (TIGR00282 family)
VKLAFIGDIVGKPGRLAIKKHLKHIKNEFNLDYVIANYENASHGFGLSEKNCKELLSYGIDMMSGGNHSFDKKDIFEMFDRYPLIRPINYPKATPGSGIYTTTINDTKVAIINLMGYYTMPLVDNPFTMIVDTVESLEAKGFKHIIIDFHAEASSEKNALLYMLRDKVSAIFGTHTHIATDDLHISDGCCYVTDVGLSGCRDGVIGMDRDVPISKFLTSMGGHYDINDKCKSILQMIVFELDSDGRCIDAKRIKILDNQPKIITQAWVD